VVAQAPSSGAAAAAGSQIAFAVAAPSAPAAAANVPSVYLLRKADAQSLLMSSGFVPVFAESPSQEAAGVAFSQLPSSLDSAALGTTVVVVVSNGHVPQPAALAVPSVVGKTHADATAALNSASLQWQSLSGFNAAPKDQVFAQLPPAGGQVAAETPVLLVVSLGTLPNAGQNVVIPDVTQMDFSAARDALLAAGLPVQQADVAGGQSGKIVGQVPPAGWSVPAGTVVVVSVATAK
jgi:beta-lactam-binding protein with PASTA domain